MRISDWSSAVCSSDLFTPGNDDSRAALCGGAFLGWGPVEWWSTYRRWWRARRHVWSGGWRKPAVGVDFWCRRFTWDDDAVRRWAAGGGWYARSEARRVGKGGVGRWMSGWSAVP